MNKCRGFNRYRYNKQAIDQQAEQEGTALKRQGRYTQSKYRYIAKSKDCDRAKVAFEKLFKD